MIKRAFLESLKKYTTDHEQQESLWKEIEKNYSKRNRHYHTLNHLNALLSELEVFRNSFVSWDTIMFAIAYHDIIYNTLKTDNEEQSAEIATKRLSKTSFPEKLISLCGQLILATKKHIPADRETNLFTDADLSILGSDPQNYQTYCKQIRLEYSFYPNFVYYPARKKVLLHFLNMDSIYKTKEFSAKYELTARKNIQEELKTIENGIT